MPTKVQPNSLSFKRTLIASFCGLPNLLAPLNLKIVLQTEIPVDRSEQASNNNTPNSSVTSKKLPNFN